MVKSSNGVTRLYYVYVGVSSSIHKRTVREINQYHPNVLTNMTKGPNPPVKSNIEKLLLRQLA